MSSLRARGAATLAGVALVMTLAAALGAAPSEAPQDGAQEARVRGQALFEEKIYGEAIDAFRTVVQSDSPTAQDWLNLALALYEDNRDEESMVALQRGLEIDSDHAGIHYLMGLIHKRQGRLEEARGALRLAAALDPTGPAIRFNYGAVLDQLDDDEAARGEFEAVIAMGFDVGLQHYVSSLFRTFTMLQQQGDMETAREYATRFQEHQRRLSQAQRAPAALEDGRYSDVVVPRLNRASATPATVAAVEWSRSGVGTAGAGVAADVDGSGEALVVVTGDGGAIRSGDRSEPLATPPGPAALGDYDRDGLADLYVAAAEGDRIFRQVVGDTGPGFVAAEVSGMPAGGEPTSVTWVDADHDGDLDVLVGHRAPGGAGLRLVDNRGGGEFTDVTAEAGLDAPEPTRTVTWGDLDDDQDVDLVALRESGEVALYTNLRGGRFEEIAEAVGAAGPGDARDLVVEDLDNDGDLDLALASGAGVAVLRNHGDGTFASPEIVAADIAVTALVAADVNRDGHLDLIAGSADGARVLAGAGPEGFEATDTRLAGVPLTALDAGADGSVDVLVRDGDELAWHTGTGAPGSWLSVRLEGIKNNHRGIGSTVEVKGGGLYQIRPVRHGVVHFGVGDRAELQVVRITWPNGIVQNELDVTTDAGLGPVVELERLEGSCPLLYTWDGERWRFINEVLGVAPLGMPLAEGVVHPADFDEYVPVPGEALRPRDGVYELRFTEELREAGYLDAVRLLAVDHPRGTRVDPDEKFVAPPHPEFRLFVTQRPRAVVARDQDGRDWTAELARADGDWARPFEPGRYEGLATPHALELTLPEARTARHVRLFLTGWVYWATGSINLLVDEDPRVSFEPVRLEVPDGDGGWTEVVADIGLPNAKNSTLSVDLSEHLRRDDPRVRVSTTMRLYWDAAFYSVDPAHPDGLAPTGDWQEAWGVPRAGELSLASGGDAPGDLPVRLHALAPRDAEVRFRGFSRLQRGADGFETFEYRAVGLSAPWDQHRGHYTRYGPVGELLQDADDRYVIVGTGDEVSIRFPADLPPVPEGWERDWLVYLNGWVKDGDPNTLHGDRVEPLPFHGMSAYPYRLEESYPDTVEHRAYQERYNTRPARRINPPLTEVEGG